jgi:hypothetical protein
MLPGVDPNRNPYQMGAGSRPNELFGRDEELALARVLLARVQDGRAEQPLVFHGLRGVGKTVLLLEIKDIATEEFLWAACFREVIPGTTLREVLGRQAEQLLRDLSGRGRATERIANVLRQVASFRVTVSPDGQLGAEVGLGRGGDRDGQLEFDVTDLFTELGGAAAEADTGVLILLDEIQELSGPELTALTAALHAMQQEALPLTVVAAGLPTALARLGAARPYAERLFAYRSIGRLDEASARKVLTEPASEEAGVRYTRTARDILVVASDHYPFFLQAYGKSAWNLSAGPELISAKDAERARAAALASLDSGFFKTRTDQADRAQLRLMSAIAACGDGPQATATVEALFGAPIRELLAQLQVLGLIFTTADGDLDFTAPHLADHLRRRHPFR